MPLSPETLFSQAVEKGASDIHMGVGCPVFFRINGDLVPVTQTDTTPDETEAFVSAVLGEFHFKRLKEDREVDTAYQIKSGMRLRVNCMVAQGSFGLVARVIPSTIPAVDTMGLGEIAAKIDEVQQGLVLFTGPTGTGKSTSMASLIQNINARSAVHIITLEDPVEFVFPKGKGVVRQRQYGNDFLSFADAMKHVLRQDPDIVLVGEMRDPETIAAALTLAETGHLIFATLHTQNAMQTVNRIIDVFPSHQQAQVRSQLSMSLKMIVAQRLLPKVGGGQIAHREVLVNVPAVGNIIRENRLVELNSVLQTGGKEGMYSFDMDLKRLYSESLIDEATYDAMSGGV